jgi:hypothetical protein
MRLLSKLLSYLRCAWGFSQGNKLIKACQNAEPGTPKILLRGGQCVATVLVYLSGPEKRGGTIRLYFT